MTSSRFVSFASILFGIFVLTSVARSISNALSYPRDIGSDSLRFGFILIAAVLGLTSLFPSKVVSALRRLAEQITPNPIRFLLTVAIAVCLMISITLGAVSLWVGVPVCAVFFIAIVYPGIAFWNLSIAPGEEIGMRELTEAVGNDFRNGPKLRRYIFAVAILLFSLGFLWIDFGLSTIPAPWLMSLSFGFAIIGGGLITAVIFYHYLRLLPKHARQRSLPGYAIMAAFVLILSIFGTRAILLDLAPTVAAHFWGEETTQSTIVVKSRWVQNAKACNGSVHIQTETGEQRICVSSSEFVKSMSPGAVLVISGKTTILGQTIRNLRIVN